MSVIIKWLWKGGGYQLLITLSFDWVCWYLKEGCSFVAMITGINLADLRRVCHSKMKELRQV